jgi:dCMP deaminase
METNETGTWYDNSWLPGVKILIPTLKRPMKLSYDPERLSPMSERITRDAMLIEIAVTVSKRSTCSRKQVGAVIALDGRVLSLGYAGSPAGTPHCLDVGCLQGVDGGCIRTVHAELNAIAFAAKQGIALNRSTLYCTDSPCLVCAKAIINAGIEDVKYLRLYRDLSGLELLTEAGISHDAVPYQYKL